nr:TM1266 family iron-only hydrogenase system putative regulator [uncultured Agathobaculum sp.]
MENRIAILGIMVQDRDATGAVNRLLHEYGDCIIGRMGIPHRDRCSIITIVMDCETSTVRALSGKLGRLDKVMVKSMMAKEEEN